MEHRKDIVSYFETISLFIVGIVVLAFPLAFSTATTDAFAIPKQAILIGGTILGLLILGVKMVFMGKIKLRRTPLDVPLLLLALVTFISSFFAINRIDSLISVTPFIFAILFYFVIVNTLKNTYSIVFVLSSMMLSTTIVALMTIFTFFKVFLLPFPITKNPTFNLAGSALDTALLFAFVLPIASYILFPLIKRKAVQKIGSQQLVFSLGSVLILGGLGIILFAMFGPNSFQKPIILPFETGFQTAFASISQDAGRTVQSFFIGSGFGTYLTVFSKFKQAAYNLNPNLWAFSFFRSSSFVLELLATTGVLGLASYLFLMIKTYLTNKKETHEGIKIVFYGIILVFVASFVLPFSYFAYTILFILLGIYASMKANEAHHSFFEVEMHLVAFKKGLLSLFATEESSHSYAQDKASGRILPLLFTLVILIFSALVGYQTIRYILSDVTFQQSLVAASQNNGSLTYDLQNKAIELFPYRDSYYQIFAQTNFAIANSLATQLQNNPNQQNQQAQSTIYQLIQQSITAARRATELAPLTPNNWQNLSNIYRGLIGFGQNAENFAILTMQQAIALDPNNPQGYLNLGGIYYQLGQWDNAQRQFQISINLKRDYANAYYNLGHALEQKGDLQNALAQYQNTKTLIANDTTNVKKIDEEIQALQKKIGEQGKTPEPQVQTSESQQQNLEVNAPTRQLPERDPQVKIPGPSDAPTPTPSQSNKTVPSASPTETP